MPDVPWAATIAAAVVHRPVPIQAATFLDRILSFSNPVTVTCTDGKDYVVKGRQVGRGIVNDQIVARLGCAMGAPTGHAVLIEIPPALIAMNPKMAHMQAGSAHGCLFIANCADREDIFHCDEPENRQRFARLAVLYGWTGARDYQFLYDNAPPHLVTSVDHGPFFPGGPSWTATSLRIAPPPVPDQWVVEHCMLNQRDLALACRQLRSVDNESIARIIAAPPDDWDFPLGDRVALADYLAHRRDILAQAY